MINKPVFCPCKDPDNRKKCGNIMDQKDDWYFEWYGMCETCYIKYNSHKEDIAKEMEKQLTEKAKQYVYKR